MLKLKPVLFAESILAVCLCVFAVAPTPTLAQGRVSSPGAPEIPAEVQQRNQEIQKIIDRSDERFQAAEESFKKGDYAQARRAYDRAIDIILESGADVRSDARLQQYYQKLVEHIFQRQLALMKLAPAAPAQTPETGFVSQVNQTDDPQQKPQTDKRGFGEQTWTASPLDELARIKLTEEETKNASDTAVQNAVSSARLDFGFKPNALVQSYINYYLGRGRVTMETGLRRSGRYMTLARRIFREEGVPQDLAWLGQVESAWSPFARSWAAAVGLWQFIPATGARYGLQQDYWVDERMSFEKATRASARYLKFLANRYAGNWELAMAAYNSGEGNVDRAIARSGYADFWEIYQRGLLPNETRNYVPNILATIIIAKDPETYGFKVKPDAPLAFDTVVVNNSVDMKLVADACDVQHEYVLALNPELKRGQTPPGVPHPLRVPVKCGRQLQATLKLIPPDKRTQWRLMSPQTDDTFATIARRTGVSEATLSAINGGELKAGQKVILPLGSGGLRNVAAVAPRAAAPGTTAAVSGSVKLIAYTVRSGETLSDIAARYSISARDIAALNRISPNTKLRAGQVIKIQTRAK
jgi:membrane-bound lytic murein transglycosylase D